MDQENIPESLLQPRVSNIMKLTDFEKQKKIDLGPRWAERELELFQSHYYEHELEQVRKLQEALRAEGYDRSVVNIYSIFLKNKNFLRIKKNCNAEDLMAILADYYENDVYETQKAFDYNNNEIENLKKRILENDFQNYPMYKKEYDKSHLRRSVKKTQSMRERERDRERDRNHYNDVSYKKLKVDNSFSMSNQKMTKTNKTRAISSKGKAQINLQFESELQLFQKIEYLCLKQKEKNMKKSEFNGQSTTDEPDVTVSKNYINWIIDEYFYSYIDKPYFQFNEFDGILKKSGLKNEGLQLKKEDWNKLRSGFGKPRRFSRNFVNSELERQNLFRDRVRKWMSRKKLQNDGAFSTDLTKKIQGIQSLQVVGQNVMAVLPQSMRLHTGSILTIDGPNIWVNFNSSPELGVQKIPDYSLIVMGNKEQQPDYFVNKSDGHRSLSKSDIFDFENEQNINILRDIDHFAMAFLIKILERKTLLVNELKTFNDLAEKKIERVNESFYDDFGWIGNQINNIDNMLKHITAKFRLRGFNEENASKLGQNFENIFNVFKNNIEKEIDMTSDLDQKEELGEVRDFLAQSQDEKIVRDVLKELKQILPEEKQKYLEEGIEPNQDKNIENNKIDTMLKFMVNGNEFGVVHGLSKEEESKLMHLVLDCAGILKTLMSTHDINLKNNVFLKNLYALASNYTKECHEVSTALQNLSSKIKLVN